MNINNIHRERMKVFELRRFLLENNSLKLHSLPIKKKLQRKWEVEELVVMFREPTVDLMAFCGKRERERKKNSINSYIIYTL